MTENKVRKLVTSRGCTILVDDDLFTKPCTLELKTGGKVTTRVCDCTWRAVRAGAYSGLYALTDIYLDKMRFTIKMHRLILEAAPGKLVDHINGDTLDNRKANLRIVDVTGNGRNRVAAKGRSLPLGIWKTKSGMYRSQISIGAYSDVPSALVARDTALAVLVKCMPDSLPNQRFGTRAKSRYGQYVCCNFPTSPKPYQVILKFRSTKTIEESTQIRDMAENLLWGEDARCKQKIKT